MVQKDGGTSVECHRQGDPSSGPCSTMPKCVRIVFCGMLENGVVQLRHVPTVQVLLKAEDILLLQSIGTSRLFAERNIPNGRKDPKDDRSPARVEHHAGRECHRSKFAARMVEMPQLTREDR